MWNYKVHVKYICTLCIKIKVAMPIIVQTVFFRAHYKEYLVYTITRHHVDPVSLYDVHGIEELLEREEIDVPEISDGEDEGHRQRLIEVCTTHGYIHFSPNVHRDEYRGGAPWNFPPPT